MKIEQKEFEQRLVAVLSALRGKSRAEAQQVKELFTLHNDYFPSPKETGTHCGSCVGRVLKRMKALAEQLGITA